MTPFEHPEIVIPKMTLSDYLAHLNDRYGGVWHVRTKLQNGEYVPAVLNQYIEDPTISDVIPGFPMDALQVGSGIYHEPTESTKDVWNVKILDELNEKRKNAACFAVVNASGFIIVTNLRDDKTWITNDDFNDYRLYEWSPDLLVAILPADVKTCLDEHF